MAATHKTFGRMVLGLPHNAQDYPAIETAAELAETLGAQFFGAFIVEPAIADLGGIPGAQQLKSLSAGWQPIERDSLARDMQEAADAVRRKFSAVTGRLHIDTVFHLARGMTADIVASLASANDVVVMIEPGHPADRITRQFLSLMEAAFQASSSLLLVPSRVQRKIGPIVVVAAGPRDEAVDLAADMAGALRESLVVINPTGEQISSPALAPGSSIKCRIISPPLRARSIEEQIMIELAGVRERLIVARRTMIDCPQLRTLAEKRGVPVLVTGSAS